MPRARPARRLLLRLAPAILLLSACLEPGTAPYPTSPVVQVDFTAPVSGATDFPPDDPVAIVLDRPVSGVRAELIAGDTRDDDLDVSLRGRSIEIAPDGGFEPDTAYELRVLQVSAGDAGLGAPLVITFTTGARDAAPSFAQVQAIWAGACALSGCHAEPNPAAGMALTREAGARPIGRPSTLCGVEVLCDPEQFPCEGTCDGDGLYKVIEPGRPCQSCMLRLVHEGIMPAIGDPLTEEQIGRIERWILAGAPQ